MLALTRNWWGPPVKNRSARTCRSASHSLLKAAIVVLVVLLLAAGIWPGSLQMLHGGAAMKLWNRLMCYCAPPQPLALPHELRQLQRMRHRDLSPAFRRATTPSSWAFALKAARATPTFFASPAPSPATAVGAVKTVYDQVLGPKAVIAIGSCPATTNVFIDSRTLDGPLNKHIPVDVFVPGCPPRPDAIIQGVAKAAEILAERAESSAEPDSAVVTFVGEVKP